MDSNNYGINVRLPYIIYNMGHETLCHQNEYLAGEEVSK